jgi:uncharacterized protein YjiK
MSLQTLREDFLYRLLPEGVLDLDQRKLLRALVGGYQDRVADLRAYAAKFELLYDATAPFPETGQVNALKVTLLVDGLKVTRYLPLTPQTPKPQNYNEAGDGTPESPAESWSSAAITWAANELGVTKADVLKVELVHDPLTSVDTATLQYLAETVGAVLYTPATKDPANALAEQRRVLYTYFPRLKLKGTERSFTLLGQLLSFSDVKMTPLWGRVSPRVPNDIGNALNDPDFLAKPEKTLTLAPSLQYDPWDLADGPFFTWESVNLSTDRHAQNFYPTAVNGYNPFFTVVVGAGEVRHPGWPDTNYPKVFTLQGGGPHTKAACVAVAADPAAGIAELKFQAIAEGESFNGFQIVAPAPGRLAVYNGQLSAVKFRTSYYNLTLATDFDRFAELFGDSPVKKNTDLEANHALCADGIATAPFRPWSGGKVVNGVVVAQRAQAPASARQLNFELLNKLGLQAAQYFEELRAATRFPRKIVCGVLSAHKVIYAAFIEREVLFNAANTGATAANFEILGASSLHPLPPYAAVMVIETTQGDKQVVEIIRGAEREPNSNVVSYRHDRFSGWYDFYYHTYGGNMLVNPAEERRWVARWAPASTEIIRDEPSQQQKTDGIVGYQDRPEDELDTRQQFNVHENYAWRRDLIGAGEIIESDSYDYSEPNVKVKPLKETLTVVDQRGVEYDVLGLDPANVNSPRPIRLLFKEADLKAGLGKKAVAVKDGQLYYVGLVSGLLVADALQFNSETHRDNLVGWFPLNQHPDDSISVKDHSARGAAAVVKLSGVAASDRVWDNERGWVLALGTGAVEVNAYRDLDSQLSLAFWLKPLSGSSDNPTTIFQLGSSKVLSGSVQAGKMYKVLGGSVLYNQTTYTAGVNDKFVGKLGVTTFATSGQAEVFEVDDDGKILTQPAVEIDYKALNPRLTFYARGVDSSGEPTRAQFREVTINANQWNFVSVVLNGASWTVEVWSSTERLITATGTLQHGLKFTPRETFLKISGVGTKLHWSDVRLWNAPKDPVKLAARVRTYPFKPATLAGKPTYFKTLENGDFYTLEVLPTGWVTPARSGSTCKTYALERQLTQYNNGVNQASGRLKSPPLPGSVSVTVGEYVAYFNANNQLMPSGDILSGTLSADGDYQVVVAGATSRVVQLDYAVATADVDRQRLAQLLRYDSAGQYVGDLKFEELGLGEGQEPPTPWKLGYAAELVPAHGSVVVSTQHSALPGVNSVWLQLTAWSYPKVTPPFTNQGGATSTVTVNSSAPWPNLVPNENPIRQRVWVKGDNDEIYEVTVENGATPKLKANLVFKRRPELELLNASALNASQRDKLQYKEAVSAELVNHGLKVREEYNQQHAGEKVGIDTSTTTAASQVIRLLFSTSERLELDTRVRLKVTASVAGLEAGDYDGVVVRGLSQAAWQQNAVSVSGYDVLVKVKNLNNFNPAQKGLIFNTGSWQLFLATPVVYPTSGYVDVPPVYLYSTKTEVLQVKGSGLKNHNTENFNDGLNCVVLKTAGILSFDHSDEGLSEGSYLLSLDVGNLGQLDPRFPGFAAEISIVSESQIELVKQVRLLKGAKGYNSRQLEALKFYLDKDLDNWTLLLEWTNSRAFSAQGYQRQLAIYGYSLFKLETRAFRLDKVGSDVKLTEVIDTPNVQNFKQIFFKNNLSSSNNTSGVTYCANSNTLFVVRNDPTRVYEYDLYGNELRQINLVDGWYDTEGICWLGGTRFAIAEEQKSASETTTSRLSLVNIHPETVAVGRGNNELIKSWDISGVVQNRGVEGVAYDASRELLYFITEKPMAGGAWHVRQLDINSESGNITPVLNLTDVFNQVNNLLGSNISDCSDLFYLNERFFLLTEEPSGAANNYVIEVSRDGQTIYGVYAVPEFQQPEGICLLPSGRVMYVCGEPNQLGRYEYSGPGGWLAKLSPDGVISAWEHESQKWPALIENTGEVGYRAPAPISSLLTATTPRRRLSHTLANANYLLADPPPPAPPVISNVQVSANS